MAVKMTDDDRLWCDQNKVSYEDFQKVRDVFDGNDTEKEFKKRFTYGGNGNCEARQTQKEPKKKIWVNKYTRKGTIPVHECVVIGETPTFVKLDENLDIQYVDQIERTNDILVPSDTFDTQNPLPFIFDSKEELEQCLEEAKKETLDSIFSMVETQYKTYVDVEDHYHVLLTADTIWTWLQDKFGTTHYIIITGDNGSGKNSALLVFRYLGYRVFYVVSASAAVYWSKMGNVEEGQITIAEDEAINISKDPDKCSVIKNGYASGGSVPKVDLEGGRKTDDWKVYCQKWFAMEEQPTDKEMKGILDRSNTLRFVVGDPQYNIKDVISSAGDPKYKPQFDKLIKIRNILFCWRLLHHGDIIPDVELNVKNRSAELTKPLIRLFQNSPIALEKILNSLSEFIRERNESKKASFESKLYDVIDNLRKERDQELAKDDPLEDLKTLGRTTFTNTAIFNICKEEMEGVDVPDKNGVFYSHLEGIVFER